MDAEELDSERLKNIESEKETQENDTIPTVREARSIDFPVVGIGASAGGLRAFERFFSSMPDDSGVAFVVVQHLSPPHRSILPEIIQRHTSMKVLQVTDGILVEPNTVYVIPPNHNLALRNGLLVLHQASSERGFRFPIDFFFRSLAEEKKSQAIGVVLSGTASDGSLGVRTIKSEGGLTIAQEPETAEFSDMPRNAIATHEIDFIVPPEKIGELIMRYINHQIQDELADTRNPTLAAMGSLQKLYYLLRTKTGHDFSLYKQSTLLRRIDRRIKLSLVPNLEAYIRFIQEHPEEIDSLFHEMLINVTQFFRDPDAFEALNDKAIRPMVMAKMGSQAPIRVWVAGCSSGEEAYSIAISIQEQLDFAKADIKVQIYATDLDMEAVAAARRGIYVDGTLENVSPERLQKFFTKEEDGYHVKKSVRDIVVFSNQNLIFDPPFSRIDLLSCRNVLIYLEQDVQKQLFPLFHYSLNPDGVLFLGNSESAGGFNELFGVLDRKWKIYQRKDVVIQHRISTRVQPGREPLVQAGESPEVRRSTVSGLRDWTEKELLRFHTPACVIVDEKNNVIYIHGHTGKFLEPSSGEASNNVLRMAREGLKAELASAIRTSLIEKQPVTRHGVRVKTNGDYQWINLLVKPVDWDGTDVPLTLVIFEELQEQLALATEKSDSFSGRDQRVIELEKALKDKDDYLTSVVDELEETNQELKSINEELLSSNEEMQSSNEELETSREELQSINEEMSTVNAELQSKNLELTMLNNDVYNLLASTEIGTIFVDLDLQVRRFTPAIRNIYSFMAGDIGRPLRHFHSNLMYDRLLQDIEQVLDKLTPKAIEAQTHDGTWYLVNIQPYRTLENVIDGAVITFVDITRQKQRDEQRLLNTIMRDSNDALIVTDFNGNIKAWNQTAIQMYGWSEAEALKMNIEETIPEHLRKSTRELYQRLKQGEIVRPHETQRITRTGRILNIWVTPSVLYDYTNQPIAISTVERDITERRQSDQRARFENRALKALTAWYRNLSANGDAISACEMLVSQAGYRLAWLGRLDPSASESVTPVEWAGAGATSQEPPALIKNLAARSQKFVDKALKTRKPVAIRGILSDPGQRLWHENALTLGFDSMVALPSANIDDLRVLVIYADEPEAFVPQEIEYLQILMDELVKETGPA